MSILSQQKQSVNTDFPNLRPSLDLRFALAKKLDPRITFTRGSSGTYFGPDGLMRTAGVNEPRFDHDPVTGQSLGLLIEESRINSLLYSQDFSNAAWINSTLFFSYNNVTGLDGTTTASTFTANSTSSLNALYQNFTCTASTTYTFSFYVKLGTLPASSYKIAVYNNTALSFIAADVVPTQTLSSNSWTRVSYTFTTPAGCVSARVYPYRNAVFAQNNGTFYVWGAQVEVGAFPTSYIPTVAATVTRSADVASMTGTNFSSWYNQSEGSVVLSAIPYYSSSVSGFGRLISINDGSSGGQVNTIQIITFNTNSQILGSIWNTSINQFGISKAIPSGTKFKVALGISSNNCSGTFDGILSGRDTSVLIPTFDRMSIGSYNNTQSYMTMHISRFTYYPIQLTNQQLINLTS